MVQVSLPIASETIGLLPKMKLVDRYKQKYDLVVALEWLGIVFGAIVLI